jgi:hypothetical protein
MYEIIGQDKENCLARMKVINYELTYYPEIINSLLDEGKTREDIDIKQKENSMIIIGAGQICQASKEVKFGDILNQNLIISNIDDNNFITVDNLNLYNSGLACESYVDNPKIETNSQIITSSF